MTERKLKALDENELKQVSGGATAKALARINSFEASGTGNGCIGCGSMYLNDPVDDRYPTRA